MARMEDWQKEIHLAVRKEEWSLTGPSRIVKVTAMPAPGAPANLRTATGGYITLAKSIGSMTPSQIEKNLGLPLNFLVHGAVIYNFLRLPAASEYTHELPPSTRAG